MPALEQRKRVYFELGSKQEVVKSLKSEVASCKSEDPSCGNRERAMRKSECKRELQTRPQDHIHVKLHSLKLR